MVLNNHLQPIYTSIYNNQLQKSIKDQGVKIWNKILTNLKKIKQKFQPLSQKILDYLVLDLYFNHRSIKITNNDTLPFTYVHITEKRFANTRNNLTK